MCYNLLKDFAGPVATIIAAAVAVFVTWRLGSRQAATAQQQANTALKRLNLDLYEKRFNIYTAALDLYQADMKKELLDIKEAEFRFVQGFRESLFLFQEQDGIYKTLEKIKDGQAMISAHEEAKAKNEHNSDIETNAANARIEFEKLLLTLERKLTKYLDFRII
jgi:hypothetical protein